MASLTRQEILELLILQAKSNGFEFRKWYRNHLETPGSTLKRQSPTWPEANATLPCFSRTTSPGISGNRERR